MIVTQRVAGEGHRAVVRPPVSGRAPQRLRWTAYRQPLSSQLDTGRSLIESPSMRSAEQSCFGQDGMTHKSHVPRRSGWG